MVSVFVESSDSQRPKKYHLDFQNYFTKNAGGKKVLCRLCDNEYSYLETMSKLRDHLIRYHNNKYKKNDTIESVNK